MLWILHMICVLASCAFPRKTIVDKDGKLCLVFGVNETSKMGAECCDYRYFLPYATWLVIGFGNPTRERWDVKLLGWSQRWKFVNSRCCYILSDHQMGFARCWGEFVLPKNSEYSRRKELHARINVFSICKACFRGQMFSSTCIEEINRARGNGEDECDTAEIEYSTKGLLNFDPAIKRIRFSVFPISGPSKNASQEEKDIDSFDKKVAVVTIGTLDGTSVDYLIYELPDGDPGNLSKPLGVNYSNPHIDGSIPRNTYLTARYANYYCTRLISEPYPDDVPGGYSAQIHSKSYCTERKRVMVGADGNVECISIFGVGIDANLGSLPLPSSLPLMQLSAVNVCMHNLVFKNKDNEIVDVHRILFPEEFARVAKSASKRNAEIRQNLLKLQKEREQTVQVYEVKNKRELLNTLRDSISRGCDSVAGTSSANSKEMGKVMKSLEAIDSELAKMEREERFGVLEKESEVGRKLRMECERLEREGGEYSEMNFDNCYIQ